MHDKDKNILDKYNILYVIVKVKKKKRERDFYWGFYICKEMCGVDDKRTFLILGKNQGWSNLFRLLGCFFSFFLFFFFSFFTLHTVISDKVEETWAMYRHADGLSYRTGRFTLNYENSDSVTASTNILSRSSLAIHQNASASVPALLLLARSFSHNIIIISCVPAGTHLPTHCSCKGMWRADDGGAEEEETLNLCHFMCKINSAY